MRFKYDPAESAEHKAKHGVDFETAQALWKDPDAFTARSPYPAEQRFLVVGAIAGKIWTAIVAPRGEGLRIISVRRARGDEAEAYHRRRAR